MRSPRVCLTTGTVVTVIVTFRSPVTALSVGVEIKDQEIRATGIPKFLDFFIAHGRLLPDVHFVVGENPLNPNSDQQPKSSRKLDAQLDIAVFCPGEAEQSVDTPSGVEHLTVCWVPNNPMTKVFLRSDRGNGISSILLGSIPIRFQPTALFCTLTQWISHLGCRDFTRKLADTFTSHSDCEATWIAPCLTHAPRAASFALLPSETAMFHPPPEAPQKSLINIGDSYLTNKSFNIVTIHRPPLQFIGNNSRGGITATGVAIDLIGLILKRADARAKDMLLPYDGTFGSLVNNGTRWNGMVGMVSRREVDVGAAGFSLTPGRCAVVDCTFPFYTEPSSLLVPPPGHGSKLFAVIRPLPKEIWLASLAVIVGLGLMFTCFLKFMEAKIEYPHEALIRDREFKPFLYNYAIFLGFGEYVEPHQNWLRVGATVVLLSGTVIGAAYSGTLVAALSTSPTMPAIETLENLVAQKDLSWVVQKGTSLVDLFVNAESGVYQLVGNLLKKLPELLIARNEQGVEMVKTGKFAFIKERSLLEYLKAEDERISGQCRLYIGKQEFYMSGMALILPKRSPHLYYFDHQIQILLQSGIMQHFKAKYWPSGSRCDRAKKEPTGPSALDLGDIQGAFFFLGIGLIAALVALVAEMIFHWWFSKDEARAESGRQGARARFRIAARRH